MEEIFNDQLSFADLDADKYLEFRRSHADRRINAMDRLDDRLVDELVLICRPYYHSKARSGRPYLSLESMVRIHLLQISLNLSDLEMESYLMSDMVARRFCRLTFSRLGVSDSSILRFRRFIEQHGFAQKFLQRTIDIATEMGVCSQESVSADATFIDAPGSTKNQAHARDPEMASGKKAETWHFGMKEHIIACALSGIIQKAVAGPANEHDVTRLVDLLNGSETNVFLDSGYTGCYKRTDIKALKMNSVSWHVAAKPSTWKKELACSERIGGKIGEALVTVVNLARQLEHSKASIRCSVEWCFLWLKRIYGYSKTRYRGLHKNHSRAMMLFGLYNWYRLNKWQERLRESC